MKKNSSGISKTHETNGLLSPDTKAGWLSDPRNQGWFIFFLALALYVNTLPFGFNLDDGVVLTGNKFTLQGIRGIPGILSHDAFYGYFNSDQILEAGRFRPLTQILFAIEYQIFGLNPFIGHLVNIFSYALCCMLLFRLLLRLLPDQGNNGWQRSLAFISVLIYTAHPLHTEVVANIKGLDEIASFLFCLLALQSVISYLDSGGRKRLLPIFLFFFLALLSKESAVTFLIIIPMTCWFFLDSDVKKLAPPVLSAAGAFAAYMAMRVHAIGLPKTHLPTRELLNDPFLGASLAEKYATIIYTWGRYFLLLIFPHPLTHDYYPKQIPIVGWTDIRVIISLIIVVALIAFALLQLRKKNIYSFAILFFFLAFSVSSNLIVPVGTFMNERFMFIASFGFCLALATFIVRSGMAMRLGTALLVIILLGYSVKTVTRNPAWKDGYTLFTTDVKVSSNSAKCNTSAGGMMMEKALKMPDGEAKKQLLLQAVGYLQKAVEIYPGSFNAWLVLGRATIELRDFKYARTATENCLRINHSQPDAINNMIFLGQQFTKAGDYQSAVSTYQSLLSIHPEKYELNAEIATGLIALGKTDSAKALLEQTILAHPGFPLAYGKLGDIYGQHLNDLDRAMELYKKAEALKTPDPTVYENMGVINGMRKNYPESIECFRKAIALSPANISLYRNIATSYNNLGRKDEMRAALAAADSIEKRTMVK